MSDYEIYVCLFRLFELEATVSIIFLASGLSSGHHIDKTETYSLTSASHYIFSLPADLVEWLLLWSLKTQK